MRCRASSVRVSVSSPSSEGPSAQFAAAPSLEPALPLMSAARPYGKDAAPLTPALRSPAALQKLLALAVPRCGLAKLLAVASLSHEWLCNLMGQHSGPEFALLAGITSCSAHNKLCSWAGERVRRRPCLTSMLRCYHTQPAEKRRRPRDRDSRRTQKHTDSASQHFGKVVHLKGLGGSDVHMSCRKVSWVKAERPSSAPPPPRQLQS